MSVLCCMVCFRYGSSWCRNRSRLPFLFASLVFLMVLAASGCEKHEAARSEKEQKPVEVTVVTVSPRDVPITPRYVAQVQSSRQVNIQARVSGFLERRVYTEGTVVDQGETLFLMDQKPFKVQLEQAKAALARQEAALETARRNLARVKPLAAANALSQKDLDDATGQFEASSAAVEQARASVEQAKLNLSYTVITSPVTGITGSAQQADGTYLSQSNSQLTTVAVISPAYVNFSISENERLRYRDEIARGLVQEPKDRNYIAEIVLADGSIFPYTGQVTFASPSFSAQTGTFLIRVSVDNPDGLLRPNQFVHVRLKGAVRPNAILVPQRGVQQGAKGHFTWVVNKEGKAEYRPVVIGDLAGNDVFITEGLRGDEQVVIDGGLTLRAGAPVSTRPHVPDVTSAPASTPPQTDSGKADSARDDKQGRK